MSHADEHRREHVRLAGQALMRPLLARGFLVALKRSVARWRSIFGSCDVVSMSVDGERLIG